MSRLSLLPIDTLSFLTPAVQERSCSERSTSSEGLAHFLLGPGVPPALCWDAPGTRDAGRRCPCSPAARPRGCGRAALRFLSALQAQAPTSRKNPPPPPPRQPRTAHPLPVKRTRHASSSFDQVHFPHVLRARKANSPLMEKNSLLYLHDAHLIVGFIFYFLFFSSFSSCL